jgi:hypothetical protein
MHQPTAYFSTINYCHIQKHASWIHISKIKPISLEFLQQRQKQPDSWRTEDFYSSESLKDLKSTSFLQETFGINVHTCPLLSEIDNRWI